MSKDLSSLRTVRFKEKGHIRRGRTAPAIAALSTRPNIFKPLFGVGLFDIGRFEYSQIEESRTRMGNGTQNFLKMTMMTEKT